jgi:hypothetical protein
VGGGSNGRRQGNAGRFGLDYPIGINMQALLDIYNMSMTLKLDELTQSLEPEINNYYSILYSK